MLWGSLPVQSRRDARNLTLQPVAGVARFFRPCGTRCPPRSPPSVETLGDGLSPSGLGDGTPPEIAKNLTGRFVVWIFKGLRGGYSEGVAVIVVAPVSDSNADNRNE